MDPYFVFRIFHPKGKLSNHIQGIWSTAVYPERENSIRRWLHSDAGSGILFNLSGTTYLGDDPLSSGVTILPVRKQTHPITLMPSAQLAGVRFHPAAGFGILGRHYDAPTKLKTEHDHPILFDFLHDQLSNILGHYARIVALYRWL